MKKYAVKLLSDDSIAIIQYNGNVASIMASHYPDSVSGGGTESDPYTYTPTALLIGELTKDDAGNYIEPDRALRNVWSQNAYGGISVTPVDESSELSKKNVLAKKSNGRFVREVCNSILDLVIGNNKEKNLADVQLDQMEVDYALIFKHLQNYRPLDAKAAIVVLIPDGLFVTHDDKEEYLAEFAKFGL
jgi:hypothetical protein